MKNKLPTILLSLSLTTTLFGLDVGQEIELDSYLNARTNPNFTKFSKNIKTTLAKGTTGEVLEVKDFNSGNAGIKMKVTSGPKAGQSYWVYYNSKAPAIKVVVPKTQKEMTVHEIKHEALKVDGEKLQAETKEAVPATRDLEEHAITETAKEVQEVKVELEKVFANTPNIDCNQARVEPSEVISVPPSVLTLQPILDKPEDERDYLEVYSVTPYRDVPRAVKGYPKCVTVDPKLGNYDVCTKDGKIDAFKLTNRGPNKVVEKSDYYINRSYEFQYDDRAKSDIKLLITDSPDETVSHSNYKVMLFFPRTVLPSVKHSGEELIVTLPNQEVVKFDTKTKQIIGGVLTEGKMAQNGRANASNVNYTGNGVVITANKSGDLPYGDIELDNGKSARSITIATVSKKGHPDCKIPSKDLWYNDAEKDNVLIKPEFQSDAGLDKFIQKRCGFSLF